MPVRLRGNGRSWVVMAHDVALAAISYLFSLWLRLGSSFFTWSGEVIWLGLALFTLVAAVVFWWAGLHKRVWRYVSLDDLFAIVRAVFLVNLVFLVTLFMVTRLAEFPRSTLAIDVFVLTGLMAAPRVLYRLSQDRAFKALFERGGARRVPVLLIGWGDAADLFARRATAADATYRIVGLIEDRTEWQGRRVRGMEVLGRAADLPSVVERLTHRGIRPERLVIGSEATGAEVRTLLDAADRLAIPLSRLPPPSRLEHPSEPESDIRPIAVEDLLGRPQAVLDRSRIQHLIGGKRVMVTGAGGSIGGELARQIAELAPAHLALFDISEYALYQIDLELAEGWPEVKRTATLGDVRDRARVEQIMARERPELVFHAAALKHVLLMETNPNEAVLTNVIGTRTVADAARGASVEAMVLISTDKAVNPSSIMGASKRLAEAYCQALDIALRPSGGTRIVTVRFGNVLGSTGSVVPLFKRQLARGGPLTVTHKEMTRFFMTVREAVELVLHASVPEADAADVGAIHVLDMGPPVKILDLAHQMIRLAGKRPEIDVKIEFVGLRPGEKLSEELFHDGEASMPTSQAGILLARPRTADHALLSRALDELAEAARQRRSEQTLQLIRRLVPEYQAEAAAERKVGRV
ncbi:MAG: polysaccharide biosynthesis protein [Proteobacteria bacterium]|nr:polysaccharide biosynthesis protein [Pseudomonadota bacterium]MBI3500023.1 polysaccharide biosynthesis protein [Pseudomonadota bacterium]